MTISVDTYRYIHVYTRTSTNIWTGTYKGLAILFNWMTKFQSCVNLWVSSATMNSSKIQRPNPFSFKKKIVFHPFLTAKSRNSEFFVCILLIFFSRKSKQNIWVWKLQILKTLQIINQWLICSYMIAKDWIQLLQFILLINWFISSNPDFCQNLK